MDTGNKMTDMLTEDEINVIASAARRGSKRILKTYEIDQTIRWASGVRVQLAILDSILDGLVFINVPDDDGDLIFTMNG